MTTNEVEPPPYARRLMLQNRLAQFAIDAPKLKTFASVQAYFRETRVAELFAVAVRAGDGGWLRQGAMFSATLSMRNSGYQGPGVRVHGGNQSVSRPANYRYGIHLPTLEQTHALNTPDLPEGAYTAYWQQGANSEAFEAFGLPDTPARSRRPSTLLKVAMQAALDVSEALDGRGESIEAMEARLAEMPADLFVPQSPKGATA